MVQRRSTPVKRVGIASRSRLGRHGSFEVVGHGKPGEAEQQRGDVEHREAATSRPRRKRQAGREEDPDRVTRAAMRSNTVGARRSISGHEPPSMPNRTTRACARNEHFDLRPYLDEYRRAPA